MAIKVGPFTGRGKKITGAEPGGKHAKYTPGDYYARIGRGVYRESDNGHGTFAGIETQVAGVRVGYSAEENAPHAASNQVGRQVSWVFNLHIGKRYESLGRGNLNNLAQAIYDTVGFMECISEEEALHLDELLELEEEGDDEADPAAFVLDLMVQDGGEKFASLPLRVVAKDATGENGNLFCSCTCYPVTEEELEEYF